MRIRLSPIAAPLAGALLTLPAASPVAADSGLPGDYASNLELLRGSSVRNTAHDDSDYREKPMSEIKRADHLGDRKEYLPESGPGNTGVSERHFPVPEGGQFRTSCEFSHFAYDDPLVFPDEPGAAHLHVFWGNTDVNAFTRYETLIDSGSGTCNGQELNRTGYWAPAMFDAEGNVRIPFRIAVYYKGYGDALEKAEVYPPRSAMIATTNYDALPPGQGGSKADEFSFHCTNKFRATPRVPAGDTIPVCDGAQIRSDDGQLFLNTLEMHVKFPNCLWLAKDPADPESWFADPRNWGGSRCGEGALTTPNIEYIIQYAVEADETTDGWFLSSDVNPMTLQQDQVGGASVHADWWGGWNPGINREFIERCTTFARADRTRSGCGLGYLSDGGENNKAPKRGPALKLRPQYTGPAKVAARTLFDELCPIPRDYTDPASAAYCKPGGHDGHAMPGMPDTPVVPDTPEQPPAPVGEAVLCDGYPVTILGTEGDDDLRGTAGRDVIASLGGNDKVRGLGGDDTICLGAGDDRAWGQGGADTILGGPGNDSLRGGGNGDVLVGGPGDDRLYGGNGDDWLYGRGGDDLLDGGRGDENTLDGGTGDNTVL